MFSESQVWFNLAEHSPTSKPAKKRYRWQIPTGLLKTADGPPQDFQAEWNGNIMQWMISLMNEECPIIANVSVPVRKKTWMQNKWRPVVTWMLRSRFCNPSYWHSEYQLPQCDSARHDIHYRTRISKKTYQCEAFAMAETLIWLCNTIKKEHLLPSYMCQGTADERLEHYKTKTNRSNNDFEVIVGCGNQSITNRQWRGVKSSK